MHDPRVLPMSIHEALDAWLQRHPMIAPVRDGRVRATDLSAKVFSQDAILSTGARP